MPTINQSIEVSIGGQRYSTDNTYTGSNISTIDGTFTVNDANDHDIPIYAESDTDGDIKFIAFKSNFELDKMKLLDSANAEVLDLLDIIPDSTIVANKTYQIPGSADLPTVTTANDVAKLRISAPSGTLTANITITLSILFNVDIDTDSIA